MKLRIATVLIIVLLVAAFFATRLPLRNQGSAPAYATLVAGLHRTPVADTALQEFIRGGIPALDYLLADFSRSDFAKQTNAKLTRGFNLGKAIDEDIYASNVVKIAEAFGPIGTKRLLARLPPAMVKQFGFDTPEFVDAGILVVKPLLTLEVVRLASPNDRPRILDWMTTYLDPRPLRENNAATPQLDVLIEALAHVAERAASETKVARDFTMAERAKQGDISALHPEIPREYWLDQLSPSVRTRVLLMQLNPDENVSTLK